MQIKTYNEVSPHTSKAIMKNSTNNKAGENVEKREPSCSVGGKVNWYTTMDNSMDFLKN